MHLTLKLDRHFINTSVDTWSTLHEHLCWQWVENWLTINQLLIKCSSSADRVSIGKCWLSMDLDVDWGYRLRVLIDTRPWMPLVIMIQIVWWVNIQIIRHKQDNFTCHIKFLFTSSTLLYFSFVLLSLEVCLRFFLYVQLPHRCTFHGWKIVSYKLWHAVSLMTQLHWSHDYLTHDSIQYCLGLKTRRQDKTMFPCICTDFTGFQSINRGIEIDKTCVLFVDSDWK